MAVKAKPNFFSFSSSTFLSTGLTVSALDLIDRFISASRTSRHSPISIFFLSSLFHFFFFVVEVEAIVESANITVNK